MIKKIKKSVKKQLHRVIGKPKIYSKLNKFILSNRVRIKHRRVEKNK